MRESSVGFVFVLSLVCVILFWSFRFGCFVLFVLFWSFRWFRSFQSFRFSGFALLFRVLEHALRSSLRTQTNFSRKYTPTLESAHLSILTFGQKHQAILYTVFPGLQFMNCPITSRVFQKTVRYYSFCFSTKISIRTYSECSTTVLSYIVYQGISELIWSLPLNCPLCLGMDLAQA